MVFTDLTITLPLLCQGLAEAYGPDHVLPARGDRRRPAPGPSPPA